MRRTIASEAGFTLIEVSLMLIAALIMVFALTPSVAATIHNARVTAAETMMADIEAGILLFQDDLQIKYFTYDGGLNTGHLIYVLVSDGDIPREVSDAATMSEWQQPVSNSATTRYDFMERHLITNVLTGGMYNELGNPEAPARGWRGPYLNPPIGPDPWGNRYAINSQYLVPPTFNDVVILSAGQNEIIETAFTGNPLLAGGDDLIRLLLP
jgi:competence protein ComGC